MRSMMYRVKFINLRHIFYFVTTPLSLVKITHYL